MSPPAADIDLAVKPSDFQDVDQPNPTKSLSKQFQHDLPVVPNVAPSVKSAFANRLYGPLQYSGSLDAYRYIESTPVIGREYPDIQLTDLLNDDQKLRDLAVLGSRYPGMMTELEC